MLKAMQTVESSKPVKNTQKVNKSKKHYTLMLKLSLFSPFSAFFVASYTI